MTERSWRESDSEAFARLGEVFTPGREEIERTILDHVPASEDESFLVVDIGCGDGWLGAAILRESPNARLLALDGSEEMLTAAGKNLAPYRDRVELRPFRLEEKVWAEEIDPPVKCFVSSLVIHHLGWEGKRGLFADLFARLEPGGALLYADVVRERSEAGRRHMSRAWSDEVRERSLRLTGDEAAHRTFEEDGWNMYEHPDPMDKPSGTSEQLRWLEDAGYEGVDAPWARAGHAVFCAYRPKSSEDEAGSR